VIQSPADCCFSVGDDSAFDGEWKGEGTWGVGHSLSRATMWVVKDLSQGDLRSLPGLSTTGKPHRRLGQ